MKKTLLLVVVGEEHLVIDLEHVSRLEVLKSGQLERSGGRPVTQYRGQIMALVDLQQERTGQSVLAEGQRDVLQVVVSHLGEEPVGLVVDQILDIVEEEVQFEPTDQQGLKASGIIRGKIMGLLDVETFVGRVAA